MLKSVQVIKINISFEYNLTHTNLKTMKTEFDITWDFLQQQQEEDKLTTNQLHLIIQTLTAYLSDKDLKELQNLFNLFNK